MPVNGRSGYKDKMEPKKNHTNNPKYQEIRDKNNYMSCILRTRTRSATS